MDYSFHYKSLYVAVTAFPRNVLNFKNNNVMLIILSIHRQNVSRRMIDFELVSKIRFLSNKQLTNQKDQQQDDFFFVKNAWKKISTENCTIFILMLDFLIAFDI